MTLTSHDPPNAARAPSARLTTGFRRLQAAYRFAVRGSVADAMREPQAAREAHRRFLAGRAGELDPAVAVTRTGAAPYTLTCIEPALAKKTLLFVHGGGFVFHDVDTFLPFLARLSAAQRVRILAFDYPKAPETEPRALVEALGHRIEGVAREVFAREGAVSLLGDSVGALSVLHSALTSLADLSPDLGLLNPLLVPGASPGFASEREFARGFFLEEGFLRWFRALALEAFGSGFAPLSLSTADFSRLGALAVWSAECDMLRDEGSAFVERARALGRDVEHTIFAGMPHDFPLYAARAPEVNGHCLDEHIGQWLARTERAS